MVRLSIDEVKRLLDRCKGVRERINSKQTQIASIKDMTQQFAEPEAIVDGEVMSIMAEQNTKATNELISGLKEDIAELCKIEIETRRIIAQVKDVDLQRVLELRYLRRLSLQEIADEMTFSYETIRKMHRKALKAVASLLQ